MCTIEVSPKINMVPVTGTRQWCKAFEAAALSCRAASEDKIRKNKVPQKLELHTIFVHQNGDVMFPISYFPFPISHSRLNVLN